MNEEIQKPQSQIELPNPKSKGDFLLYRTPDGGVRIDCLFQNETLWLTQQQMSELFGVDKSGVSRHLKNIYESGELSQEATVAKFATVQTEGQRQIEREIEHFPPASRSHIASTKQPASPVNPDRKGGARTQ